MKIFRLLPIILLGGAGLAAAPLKVVSLSPAATELICHLGGEKYLKGRSSACTYPPRILRLPVMGDFARPDTEKILKAAPDLIVTNDLIYPGAEKIFRQRGIKVLFLPCRSVKEYAQAVEKTGRELNLEAASRQELARIGDFCRKYSRCAPLRQKVLMLLWSQPVITCGEKTFSSELLRLAGADQPDCKGVAGYFKPSLKWLLSCGADTLLVFEGTGGDPAKHPLLKHLEAVKKKRIVHFPDADLLQRPGPRFTEGVRRLRRLLEAAEREAQ